MGYRLVAVSGKFGGNRRLPTGKVNPAPTWLQLRPTSNNSRCKQHAQGRPPHWFFEQWLDMFVRVVVRGDASWIRQCMVQGG